MCFFVACLSCLVGLFKAWSFSTGKEEGSSAKANASSKRSARRQVSLLVVGVVGNDNGILRESIVNRLARGMVSRSRQEGMVWWCWRECREGCGDYVRESKKCAPEVWWRRIRVWVVVEGHLVEISMVRMDVPANASLWTLQYHPRKSRCWSGVLKWRSHVITITQQLQEVRKNHRKKPV